MERGSSRKINVNELKSIFPLLSLKEDPPRLSRTDLP